jgi:hypothetical protein
MTPSSRFVTQSNEEQAELEIFMNCMWRRTNFKVSLADDHVLPLLPAGFSMSIPT